MIYLELGLEFTTWQDIKKVGIVRMRDLTENTRIGNSPVASALGAKINVAVPERGVYLITGRGISPNVLVKSMHGEVVLRLSGLRMLATLPFTSYLALRGNRDIAAIGPVTVDVNRLNRLAEMLVKTTIPKPGSENG